MRAHWIPDKLIGLLKVIYDIFTCAVINRGIPGGYWCKQGYYMLGFLCIDWVMRKVINEEKGRH